MEETIIVQFPGQPAQLVTHAVAPDAGDDEIAQQLSQRFKPGTLVTIDGAKWRIEGPGKVTLVYDPIDGMYPKGKPKRDFKEWAEGIMKKVGPLPTSVLASPTPPKPSKPKPGETWRSKDPRRTSSFKITKVRNGEVHTDDGRTIKLERMSRYERVSQ